MPETHTMSSQNANIQSGEWNYVAFSYNKTLKTCKMYINETEVGSVENVIIDTDNDMSDMFIGKKGSDRFNGVFDEISIYNKALSINDIAALKNRQSSIEHFLESDIVGNWDFNDFVVHLDNFVNKSVRNTPVNVVGVVNFGRQNTNNRSILFDGTSNYLTAQNTELTTSNLSIGVWVNPTNSNQTIVGKEGVFSLKIDDNCVPVIEIGNTPHPVTNIDSTLVSECIVGKLSFENNTSNLVPGSPQTLPENVEYIFDETNGTTSAYFNGSNSSISMGNILSVGSEFVSMSMWVNVEELVDGNTHTLVSGENEENIFDWTISKIGVAVHTDFVVKKTASPPTLSVASKTMSSVSLSWVENDNGDATVTDYLPEYKKTDILQVYFLARQDGRTEDNGQIAMESLFFEDVNGNTVSYVMDYINRNNLISTQQEMSNTTLTSRLANYTDMLSWASVNINDTLFYEQDLIRITVPKTATRVSIKYRDINPSRMQGLTVYSPTNEFATVHLPANQTTNNGWTATNFTMTYPSLPASNWTGVNTNSVSIKIMSVTEYVYTRPFDVTEFRLTDFDGNILAYTIETDFLTYEYLLTSGGSVSTGSDIVGMSNTLQSFEYRMFWYGSNVGSYFNLIPVDPSALVARVDLVFSQYDRSSDVEITFRGQTHVVPSLPSNDQATWHGTSFEDMQKQTAVYNPSVVVPLMHTLFGLESKTSYDFQLTKITDMNSPVSSVVTDSTEPILASAPTLSVASKTVSSVSLSWNPRGDHGDALVTGYELFYKKASESNFVSTSHPSSAFGANIVGLESNTSYDFQVTKNTDVNSPVSSVVTDSTEPILASAPTLSVASKTVSSVSLSWNPRGDHGDALVTGYELFYKKASESNFVSTSHPSSAFGANIVGLESNTAYHFRVIKNTNINSPVSSVVTDSTLITRRIDIYMTQHSTFLNSDGGYNVKLEELLFFDVAGVKCEYEITIVNQNMASLASIGQSMTYFYNRLTQFYRGSHTDPSGYSVGWYIVPTDAQSFYDQIWLSVQVPKSAFRMVTKFKRQERSAALFFDFPENPTGTPVYTDQNIPREEGGDVDGTFIDHFFTTDGTATGPPMFL
jgi:hypothetical protein